MPYDRQIPDAPIALSMLPQVQAENLESDDLMYLVKPNNTIGQRCKALVLSVLANWLADGNMGPIKTTELKVGGASLKATSSGPVLETLYSLAAGIIESTAQIKVGVSSWVPGNAKPSISGLYSLEAGNTDSANVKVDMLSPHTSGETRISVNAMLVKDTTNANEKLSLGPTQVNGNSKVVGDWQIVGTLDPEKFDGDNLVLVVTDSASVSTAETKIGNMEDGQMFIVLNTSSTTQEVHFSGGAVINVTSKRGVWGIKKGGYSYPLNV